MPQPPRIPAPPSPPSAPLRHVTAPLALTLLGLALALSGGGCASAPRDTPPSWTLHDPKAYRLLRHGNLDAAETAFRESVARSPGHPATYYGLGKTYFQLGQPAAAVACFESVVQLEPTFAPAWSFLGTSYLRQENNDPARRALEEALRLDPENGRALLSLAEYSAFVRGDRDEALQFLDRARSLRNVKIPPELEETIRGTLN